MQRFDAFMEQSLYGPNGFYGSGRGVAGGRSGDFLTSSEVGPLFGAVLARAVNSWWADNGRPPNFRVIDAGTGPGTLLKSLTKADPPCARAWELLGVDRAARTPLPGDLRGSVVIANELLDNLVFRVVERQARGWREVYIEGNAEGRRERLVDCPKGFQPGFELAVGQRAPMLSAARQWVTNVLERGASKLIVFDYGLKTTAELANRGGWLRTYQQHRRGHDPLFEPGQWDITTDVAVDQLPKPDTVTNQADWLGHWGIGQLVEEGRAYWQEHADAPTLKAFRMRSRVGESAALTDPSGLGSWLVLTYSS